ncbi:MAG: hypothetical protein IJP92_00905 [Lachnospiraceae bacterium]|nr:hypothetical protein [Lachnospiraceae bacterium]
MAEWSNNAVQTVNPGETIIFTQNPVPCRRGLVRHRDDTGNFLLSGMTRCCCEKSANYLVDFGANIAIPTGGTVGEISLSITIDGATIPASTMDVTPAAVEEYFNVSRAINVPVWRGCCESVSVRNTSDQPILVQSANIIFDRPDLR